MLYSKSCVSSKILGSGKKFIFVPVFFDTFPFFIFVFGFPRSKSWFQKCPSLWTSTLTTVERAFTTEIPTPCSPPLTVYAPDSNFPPAWRVVSTVVSADFFVLGCGFTGIPLPLSFTVTEPFFSRTTSIWLHRPAIASSTELSTTSQIRWWRPFGPVEPIYIAGLFLTASRPSKTFMSLES